MNKNVFRSFTFQFKAPSGPVLDHSRAIGHSKQQLGEDFYKKLVIYPAHFDNLTLEAKKI